MVAAAAPSSAPARRGLPAGLVPSDGPGTGMGSGQGGGGSEGAGRRAVGGRGREAGWRGPARPRRPPPGELPASLSGRPGGAAGLPGPGKGRRGRPPGVRCAAGPTGPGGARAAAIAAGPDRVNRRAGPSPRGADRGHCHDLGDSSP